MTSATAPRRRAQPLPMNAKPSEVNAFARWLHRHSTTCQEFREQLAAEGVQVTIDAIYRWRDGKSVPRRPTAHAIAKVTKGSVNFGSW